MNLYVPQPAYKIYAFDRGWRIMKYVTEHLFKRTHATAQWWFGKAGDVLNWGKYRPWYMKYWSYIVMAGMGLAGGTQYVSAMILAALFIVLQTVILSVWAFLSAILMGILAVATFLYARVYRIFFRCPDCHKDMPIPTFICTCGTEHTRLWPSIYGVLSHRCKTCEEKLPTLELNGRKKLSRICPHCRRPLNVGVGSGTNVHITIVGGPSTGKTNYIVEATNQFKQIYESNRYRISFTDPRHEHEFASNLSRLMNGRELLKTPDIVPQAYNLAIKAPGAQVPRFAYVYDAAGEAFNTSENTDSQVYYKYVDGIIFMIDPCAIPSYRHIHRGDIELVRDALRPSLLDVMQAYERMKQIFEASVGLKKGRYTHPIAVVVSKVDALDLEEEIGAPAASALMRSDPSIKSEEDAINILVRNFLCQYGLDHFVREIELQYSNVRYFSCSALGRLPIQNDKSSFVPIRVVDSLIWLLAKTKTVRPIEKKGRVAQVQTQVMR
jgi:Double-GTPase 2